MHINEQIRIASNILDALNWDFDTSVLVDAFVDTIGLDSVLDNLKEEDVLEWLGENKEPEQVFTKDELEEWARDNDFVSTAEMDNYDPDGYEERERY